ncbi:hypothetical protein Leryth_018169 [Lithospermum erythrorhizon]|nr:hypothetical protein Leryth_018169 [Lithospermum erythrorhizon]
MNNGMLRGKKGSESSPIHIDSTDPSVPSLNGADWEELMSFHNNAHLRKYGKLNLRIDNNDNIKQLEDLRSVYKALRLWFGASDDFLEREANSVDIMCPRASRVTDPVYKIQKAHPCHLHTFHQELYRKDPNSIWLQDTARGMTSQLHCFQQLWQHFVIDTRLLEAEVDLQQQADRLHAESNETSWTSSASDSKCKAGIRTLSGERDAVDFSGTEDVKESSR